MWRLHGAAVIVSILVGLAFFLAGTFMTPHCRSFRWSDASIQFPYDDTPTFPSWALVPIWAAPLVVYALVIAFAPEPRESFAAPLPHCSSILPPVRKVHEFIVWALVQGESLVFTLMFTEPIKLYAGRLRPDFLSRLELSGIPGNFSDTRLQDLCNATSIPIVREGRLSFPSGHSSVSACSMVPLIVFLVHHLQPFARSSLWRMVLCLSPFYLAVFVAVSRTRDHVHHFSDVLCGSLIGSFAAIIATFLNLRYVKLRMRRACFFPKKEFDGAGEGALLFQAAPHRGGSESLAMLSVGLSEMHTDL
jgi:membrane-associated phospholipid phosphatase